MPPLASRLTISYLPSRNPPWLVSRMSVPARAGAVAAAFLDHAAHAAAAVDPTIAGRGAVAAHGQRRAAAHRMTLAGVAGGGGAGAERLGLVVGLFRRAVVEVLPEPVRMLHLTAAAAAAAAGALA